MMKRETAEALNEVNNDLTIYENYCGRGMFRGEGTTGIVFESLGDLLSAAAETGKYLADGGGDFDDFVMDLSNIQTDSLGKQMIAY